MQEFNYVNHFTEIYINKEWGNGSGGGSSVENTKEYRSILEKFIIENNIKKITDYGCGDWQSTQLINWGNCSYVGVDCVRHLIDNHNQKYKKNNINFIFLEKMEEFFNFESDLLILKDVLQHWTNDEIIYFLDNVITKHEFILITNCSNQTEEWQDFPLRSRPLSCKFYPLKKFNISLFKSYKINNGNSEKEMSLIKRKNNI